MGIASAVGGLSLPIDAGVASTALADPAVVALADYIGYWLRLTLNAKLANMGGPTDLTGQVYNNACPSTNVYTYDPQQFWVRNPKPALYVWWNGRSTRARGTLVYDFRERELDILWVFSETHAPDGDDMRAGLPAAVDATIWRAHSRGSHPSYGYNGAAPGTPIYRSMGVDAWEYTEGVAGSLVPVPASDARVGGVGDGQVVRYHPALKGKVVVRERVYQDSVDPMGDSQISIFTSEIGDPLNQAEFATVVVQPPQVP